MREAEALVSAVNDVDDAMRLVVQIELSEVNQIFLAAMAASNSPFVKKLRPFQKAVETHISYIATQLPKLRPTCAAKRTRTNNTATLAECSGLGMKRRPHKSNDANRNRIQCRLLSPNCGGLKSPSSFFAGHAARFSGSVCRDLKRYAAQPAVALDQQRQRLGTGLRQSDESGLIGEIVAADLINAVAGGKAGPGGR